MNTLIQQISSLANTNLLRVDFLHKALSKILSYTGCAEAELWLNYWINPGYYEAAKYVKHEFTLRNCPCERINSRQWMRCVKEKKITLQQVGNAILNGYWNTTVTCLAGQANCSRFSLEGDEPYIISVPSADNLRAFLFIPLFEDKKQIGVLQLKSRRIDFFPRYKRELFEQVAQSLGLALLHQRTQAALRERIKELSCMYEITQISNPDESLEQILSKAVQILPAAWQYTDLAHARIVLDGAIYATAGFREKPNGLRADIVIDGLKRGYVEVVYAEDKVELDEGPFLKEERNLIDTIAHALALLVKQKKIEDDKWLLQEQLRHADRLATIGQLSAGMAHELNEPLSAILGFSQLITKHYDMPPGIADDMDKIIKASLHAREIIKKLLFFARQIPPSKNTVSLNRVVQESLYFLESRCAKAGVKLIYLLEQNLPEIVADPGQLMQVLVNLVVNAIQAMPKGGELKIRTEAQSAAGQDYILLSVEDTGEGMSKEVKQQLFIPFFTTKGIGQGTGLGLPVVHGIVTAHGGSIRVESEIGKGSKFRILLPINQPVR